MQGALLFRVFSTNPQKTCGKIRTRLNPLLGGLPLQISYTPLDTVSSAPIRIKIKRQRA